MNIENLKNFFTQSVEQAAQSESALEELSYLYSVVTGSQEQRSEKSIDTYSALILNELEQRLRPEIFAPIDDNTSPEDLKSHIAQSSELLALLERLHRHSTSAKISFGLPERLSSSFGYSHLSSLIGQDTRGFITQICKEAAFHQASDIVWQEGMPPRLKINGKLHELECPAVSTELLRRIFFESLPLKVDSETFEKNGSVNFALSLPDVPDYRFRVNLYKERGAPASVMRLIPTVIPALSELGLPENVEKLVERSPGIVLLIGPTGSGKSTTLAAMINKFNQRDAHMIVTIEDPIEYDHTSKRSTIVSREIGIDTTSYQAGLKDALRQAPDIILVGEIRDEATIRLAIQAAQTGHRVYATLHADDAADAIKRAAELLGKDTMDVNYSLLGETIVGVLSQRLLPKQDGQGRVCAVELLLTTPTIKQHIEKGDINATRKAIAENAGHYGTIPLNESLLGHVKSGAVTADVAAGASHSPAEFRQMLRQQGA